MRPSLALALLCACGPSPLVHIDDPPDAGPPPPPPPAFVRRVLFAIEVGAGAPELQAAAAQAAAKFTTEPSFGAVFFGSEARATEPLFTGPQAFAASVTAAAPALAAPPSAASALWLTRDLIAEDLVAQGDAAGLTHYRVVVLSRAGETSCQQGMAHDAACNAFTLESPPDYVQCAACELAHATRSIRRQLELVEAPRIQVQPVWVRDAADQATRYALSAAAREGGTVLIEVQPQGLATALAGLDYGPVR